jgi:hypothetical protein
VDGFPLYFNPKKKAPDCTGYILSSVGSIMIAASTAMEILFLISPGSCKVVLFISVFYKKNVDIAIFFLQRQKFQF